MRKYCHFVFLVIFALLGCSKAENISNLSFAGITIGKEFPDSLKNTFEFLDTDIPQFEGKVIFALPNCSDANLNVVAATDLVKKEVVCIQIGNMNIEQSSEFFEMLKSKYGLPISRYGRTDIKLERLLANIFSDLGYSYYNDNVDLTGNRELAVWKSVLGNTDIVMIGETYHDPKSYRDNKPWTYVYFLYVDQDKFSTTQKDAETKRINNKRSQYKEKNPQYMNQDF